MLVRNRGHSGSRLTLHQEFRLVIFNRQLAQSHTPLSSDPITGERRQHAEDGKTHNKTMALFGGILVERE